MNQERLAKIRNWQSKDWYPALFMRPLSILVMLVIADWSWLSPNILTTLANAFKIAAVALILTGEHDMMIAAAIALQVGLLFDHLDGTVARYRGCGSGFGSTYDKLSDALTWFPIVMAVAWVAYGQNQDPMMLVLGASSAYALLAMGYSKWVLVAEKERLAWRQAVADPEAAVSARHATKPSSGPPERTLGQWLKWFGWSMLQIVRFEEADLFFWVGLALVLDRLDWVLWLLAATQVVGIVGAVVVRLHAARVIDNEIAELDA